MFTSVLLFKPAVVKWEYKKFEYWDIRVQFRFTLDFYLYIYMSRVDHILGAAEWESKAAQCTKIDSCPHPRFSSHRNVQGGCHLQNVVSAQIHVKTVFIQLDDIGFSCKCSILKLKILYSSC